MADIDVKNGNRTEVVDALDIGAVIRERRAQHELTQDDLAQALGVHRRYVYELERGAPDLRLQRTIDTLKLLGVNVRLDIDGKDVQLPNRRRSRKQTQTAPPAPEAAAVEQAPEQADPSGSRRRWLRRR